MIKSTFPSFPNKFGKKLEKKSEIFGGFTREVSVRKIGNNVVVVKIYPDLKPLFVDFSKSTFSLLFLLPKISFLSKEERIQREIIGHEKLAEIGIPVPKILEFSTRDGLLVEEYIDGTNLYQLIKKSEKTERESISYETGKITGFLHSKGYSFFDNRPQNYIFKDSKIFRVDLETFEVAPSLFERCLDVISFTESFSGKIRNHVYNSFISGYETYSKYHPNNFLESLARKCLSLLNLNLPSFR
ncbi:MAG: hypothetical protein QMD12_02360 [Candidatus Aenigmarchaeota archaeon]|nr:hypothetical protein [Candidatus Aenigmarchaeota archaeon]